MMNTLFEGDVIYVSRFGDNYNIARNDILIFHYPLDDTVYRDNRMVNYYLNFLKSGFTKALSDTLVYGQRICLSVDQRQIYIKRCVALPGDTFEMRLCGPFVNSKKLITPSDKIILHKEGYQPRSQREIKHRQYPYSDHSDSTYWKRAVEYRPIFPLNQLYRWNHDVFGPMVVPREGLTIELDYANIWLYKRVIEVYENNTLEIRSDGIFINHQKRLSYTFQQNYYFMLGDNRPHSSDSMLWGFLPENHIIGKARMVLCSVNFFYEQFEIENRLLMKIQ